MWIICDQGHAINLDHFTRLDWKKAKNGKHYEVLAVRDFRHLGMVLRWDEKEKVTVPDAAFQTFRICNRPTEKAARETVVEIISEICGWVAPAKED